MLLGPHGLLFLLPTLVTQNSRQEPHLKAFSFAFFLSRNFFPYLLMTLSCNSLYANVTLWRPSLITGLKMETLHIQDFLFPSPFIFLLSIYSSFTCHIFTHLFFFNAFFFLFVVNFVIHWNETAMGLHVFPIPIPPPTTHLFLILSSVGI